MNEQNEGLDDAIIEILHLSTHTLRANLRVSLLSKGYRITDRELRRHLELLITQGKYCISSGSKGYSLITTPEALEAAKKYLQKKAFSLHERVKCLEENYKIGRLNEQLTLFA